MKIFILMHHALLTVLAYLISSLCGSLLAEVPDFSRDVLPILSDRCFHCHGPDESHRKAKLRLDIESEAIAERDGLWLIKPGDHKESLVWELIATDDEDERMPPKKAHRKPLTSDEMLTIRKWIDGGARWGKHWAFEKPRKLQIPDIATHPVDAFIRDRLQSHGMKHAEPAMPHTQLRRLSFALTGLPPSEKRMKSYKADSSDQNWARQVDQLLASPHYGERMAMWWLDAARYSDTDGFQQDKTRANWPWRDWVIKAFNKNKPFDEFTLEQFAGDLLPDATPEQILATCFHRNHMTNGEGGRHKEESRIDYVIDRVNTTGTVFLGLTLGCVQCHSHKFDPISHKAYYGLFAFFNSIDEDGAAGTKAKPYLKFTPSKPKLQIKRTSDYLKTWQKRVLQEKVAARSRFDQKLQSMIDDVSETHRTWHVLKKMKLASEDGTAFDLEADGTVQTKGPMPKRDHYLIEIPAAQLPVREIAGWRLEVFPHASHKHAGLARGGDGNFTLEGAKIFLRDVGTGHEVDLAMSRAVADLEVKKAKGRQPGKVSDVLNDDPRNGWRAAPGNLKKKHVAVFTLAKLAAVGNNQILCIQLEHRPPREFATIGRFRLAVTTDQGVHLSKVNAVSPLETLAKHKSADADMLEQKLVDELFTQYLLGEDDYREMLSRQRQLESQLRSLNAAHKPKMVQVLQERKSPRKTYVLKRGVWDAKGEEVNAAVLSSVLQVTGPVRSRKDLAEWLLHKDNPLTARVIVNQLWMNLFGHGLVRTPEDFGLQGEQPTHPKLLDWLAVELIESGWDVKKLLRLIVTSRTFRQSSRVTPEMLEVDPKNMLLARAHRFRLPAWMIRDNALAASGLLNDAIGGPPIYPWQPEGVWNEIFMGRFTYKPSLGPSQYRRTIYAFWRRSIAPTFLFDSAQRRNCEIRQRRTNTPLHALTLLNDVTMQEAARKLADLSIKQDSDQEGLQQLSLSVLGRLLVAQEKRAQVQLLNDARAYYQKHESEAGRMLTLGQRIQTEKEPAADVAAWMVVASTLLNLDEAINYE